jgi:hypothetical protein
MGNSMQVRFFALGLALLLLLSSASAQFYILDGHTVEIDVDSVGNAQISEKYFLRFQNEHQLADFRQAVSQIGVSLDGWREYDARIFPHIGLEKNLVVSGISFVEEETSLDFLEITYSLKEPIMEKKRETSRVIDFSLKTKFFNEFKDGPVWVIPEGTLISVQLPRGIEINGTAKPDALVEGTKVAWEGYATGNELFLEYSLFKQIASFDLSQLVAELMQSDLFLIVVVATAVVLGILFLKRKKISGKLEGYVISHSDLGGGEEED